MNQDKPETEDEEETNEQLGHFSDDFLRECSLDYLFYYYDKNNFELQKTIQTLTMGQYFNTTYNLTI